VSLRRTAALAMVVIPLLGGGCGRGSTSLPPSGAHSVAAEDLPTVTANDFCTNLADLNSTAQAVGLDKTLGAVRTDLARSAAKAAALLREGAPQGPGVRQLVVRLAADLKTMATWASTGATQDELDADRVPSSVRKSLDDMGYVFRQLQQWSDANCKDQQQGDGH